MTVVGRAQWFRSVIPTLERLRKKDNQFQAI
jgi:hypothetical protein